MTDSFTFGETDKIVPIMGRGEPTRNEGEGLTNFECSKGGGLNREIREVDNWKVIPNKSEYLAAARV